MAARDLGAKLLGRIDDGIDLPRQSALRVGNPAHHFLERNGAEDEEVEIALLAQRTARNRTEQEGSVDVACQRGERVPDHRRHPGGLLEQGLQLRKIGSVGSDLEVDLPPVHPAVEKARAGERVELALHRPLRGAALPDNLPQVEGLVGMAEEKAEHTPPGLPEQHLGGIERL